MTRFKVAITIGERRIPEEGFKIIEARDVHGLLKKFPRLRIRTPMRYYYVDNVRYNLFLGIGECGNSTQLLIKEIDEEKEGTTNERLL